MSKPSPNMLLAAKVYFFIVCAYSLYTTGRQIAAMDPEDWPRQVSLSGITLVAFVLILLFAQMVGLFGYAWQRRLAVRGFWHALFILEVGSWVMVVVAIVTAALLSGSSLFDSSWEWLEFLLGLPQLLILFAYACLSNHLWHRRPIESGAPSP